MNWCKTNTCQLYFGCQKPINYLRLLRSIVSPVKSLFNAHTSSLWSQYALHSPDVTEWLMDVWMKYTVSMRVSSKNAKCVYFQFNTQQEVRTCQQSQTEWWLGLLRFRIYTWTLCGSSGCCFASAICWRSLMCLRVVRPVCFFRLHFTFNIPTVGSTLIFHTFIYKI